MKFQHLVISKFRNKFFQKDHLFKYFLFQSGIDVMAFYNVRYPHKEGKPYFKNSQKIIKRMGMKSKKLKLGLLKVSENNSLLTYIF